MNFSFSQYKAQSPGMNFLILCLILSVNYLSAWLLAETPLLATLPIVLVGVLALWYARSMKLLITYLLFALAGAGQEAFFIANELWSYSYHDFFAIPLYLPFVWGNIAILSVGVYKGIFLVDTKKQLLHQPPNFTRALFFTFFTALTTLLSLYFFGKDPLLLMGIFFLIDIVYVFLMRSLLLALVGIVAMTCGSFGDLVSVALGIWSYPLTSTIAGIPPYIFIGWDIVGLLIVGIYILLDSDDAPWAR